MNKVSFGMILFIVAIAAIGIVIYHNNSQPKTGPASAFDATPIPTPEPKPLKIDVKVTPWGDMYRKEPDCKEDFSVELVHPSQNENFTTDTFDIVINAGAYYWVVQKAYYTSDLFSGERWINISFSQYARDLQKTFTFSLSNVPDGQHELTLTVIFHDGTRRQLTLFFNVLSERGIVPTIYENSLVSSRSF
jgi:hypothetical protein